MGNPVKRGDNSTVYTYGDYLQWPEDERVELIDGIPFLMAPAPSRRHQELIVNLLLQIGNQLEARPCKVYTAPFDVRLPSGQENDEDIRTVVQPDIVVVCDRSKLDERGCKGSPDWIIEVLSPGTASRDYVTKLALYEKNGVKEYWIVHPLDRIVMVFRLNEEGKYSQVEFFPSDNETHDSTVKVSGFGGTIIDLKHLFAEEE